MKQIKIVPHPDGGWVKTSSKQTHWPSYMRRLKAYPSAIDAMIAARQSHPASAVCWIACKAARGGVMATEYYCPACGDYHTEDTPEEEQES